MDQPHIEYVSGGRGEEQETRERILSAARQLMAQKGYKGATTRKISELAGVNEVTIFRHFKTKVAILEELLKDILEVREQLEQGLQGEFANVKEMLITYARTYYHLLVERKEILMICIVEADNHPEVVKLFSSLPMTAVEVLGNKLTEFQEQGHLPKSDPCTAALMFISTFFYAFMAKYRVGLDVPIIDDEEQLYEHASEILLQGIRRV
ncbi:MULTISPECIES: TetR/AcrR family transcriptional regulator [Brevibacillus]|jgi:AcrR family transcriptional regulator|uniref:TetR family transcriptional regulator n=1 Tax=Brevibacillus parabrevis TaxID=54914 RepID=A0A4Y3PEW6_BREPA|nr:MULTISPECIES: TetR/AcrR family transcriptional regulator [Brevibacillus]TGV18469.1 TetR/AcrR family transcriptional regulator [Mesorhizobium sp. M00.F.Ca.ET.186.01.1.1]KZE49410.1 transcriptional regulator [Brevibacillus parabrevis]MBU8713530.1 TetR/AcrR family transcriptional regulator [Brevibacillus parabrevis]MDH6351024.1 AcrR family transcriptional regulator [Brevibacillus sp. 1238]MDR4997730.1 TetR/AcrR family transcriptional regulator [Brevibacillus parabrevis]